MNKNETDDQLISDRFHDPVITVIRIGFKYPAPEENFTENIPYLVAGKITYRRRSCIKKYL